MDNRDYELFVRIVAEGSLTSAARTLGISPAMASKRLAALEDRLGVALIHRTTRRISATQAGIAFHADVVAILTAIESAEGKLMGRNHGPSGVLKVTAPTSFGRMHIAPFIGRFLNKFPEVRLDIDLSDRFSDLVAEQVDVAVRIAPVADVANDMHLLAPNRRILCAAPDYISTHGEPRTIRALAQHRLLAASNQLPWRLHDGRGRRHVIQGDSHVRTNSSEVARELCLAGVGIALRSLWDVATELGAGKLLRILPELAGVDSGIYAVVPPPGRPSPAARAFIGFLTDLYNPGPYWEQQSGAPD